MRKRKSGVENFFVSTPEEILIALLDEELGCGELAERVGITKQHLSRLLPRLEDHELIYSRYPKMRRINRLTCKGRLLALLALRKKRTLKRMRVSEEQTQELMVWAGEDVRRK